jgi:hypothetical protein
MISILHGVPITIPDDWEDWSVFKFTPPAEAKAALPVKGEVRGLQPNLIVTRRPLEPGVAIAEVYRESNRAYKEVNPSFQVLAEGVARYQGLEAVWQDSSQVDPRSNLSVHQRHVAIAPGDGVVVLLTLTGEKRDLERLAAAIGLTMR